jgi:hypothetical protein
VAAYAARKTMHKRCLTTAQVTGKFQELATAQTSCNLLSDGFGFGGTGRFDL